MLQTNLDPEVAERPEDLVVYGGTGRAARSWPAYHAMLRTLTTLADDDDTRTGSVLIINVPDRKAADEWSLNEPFRKAGLFDPVTVTRMRRGQWNPGAAPETAEGN